MEKLKVLFNKHGAKVATASALLIGSSTASAVVDQTLLIGTISDTAELNQAAIIAAVIGLAAISFGVGMIVRWLK